MTIEKKYRPRCFFDVEVGGQSIGRIVFELYSDVCPITCENFRCLCTGEKGIGKCTGKALHYKNTIFHRVVKGFMVQGGDFSAGNGSGGESIYGGTFPDENFDLNHESPYCLSMANRGKDTNGSQFFITTLPAPHLDGVHVVFGHVISGQEIVSEVENQLTDQSSRPFTDVRIFNCGELVLKPKSKSKHRKSDKASSPLEEGEMSDDKSKHKKKHKKHSKKSKKEKSRRKEDEEVSQNDLPRAKREADLDCSVRADEIPDIPTNNFLMRRGPAETEEPRRPPFRSEGYVRRTKISKSGRKIKGRGHMRYRTPSPEGSRSGSETPPHWRQAQSRVRSLKEVLEEKRKLLEELEAQESNGEETQDTQGQKLPGEDYSNRLHRHREVFKEQYEFQRELEIGQDHRSQDVRSGSSRHHSDRSGAGARGHNRERPPTRREEMSEARAARETGRGRERRSHRRREDSEEEYDSSTSPVRRGMQSTVISKVVYQNKPSEIVTTPAVRVVRRFTEEKLSKSKHDDKEKRNRTSSFNNNKSPTGLHSKQNVEEGERNGVSGHRHHHHRHHHRHKIEKGKPSGDVASLDAHAELGQSPMASLEVDKDTSIVDMDCTPIIHQTNEEDNPVMTSAEKKLPHEDYLVQNVVPVAIEKREHYREPEPKVSDSPRIRIPGLGSDDESDGSVEEEPPPPPGTEDIVLFKNYPPAMPPMIFVAESKEQDDSYEAVPKNASQQEQFIPVPPTPEKEVTAVVEDFPLRQTTQRLPFLDDDTDDEKEAQNVTVTVPPPPSAAATAIATAVSPVRKTPPSPEKSFITSSNEVAKRAIQEKNTREKRSPSPRKSEVKDADKPHYSTKPTESSARNSRADRSSSRSRTLRRRSRSHSSHSPRRGSSTNRRRSLSRGRKRPSPPYRNRSPIWRRSSDYRRPVDAGRRRRSPSPNRRRSRSHSRNRSRRTPPRYNRRRSRSLSRGRRGKRSRSSSSSSSNSSNSSRRRPKRGRKPSRSRSSSSSSSHSSTSSSSSSSS